MKIIVTVEKLRAVRRGQATWLKFREATFEGAPTDIEIGRAIGEFIKGAMGENPSPGWAVRTAFLP